MKLILAILLLANTSFAEQVSPLSQDKADFFPIKLVNIAGNFYDADALPIGASTEAKQDLGNGYLLDIKTAFATLNAKDFATSAKQDTGNTSLSSIDGKFTTLNAKDFATSAKQDIGNGYLLDIRGFVDGIEGSLSSIDAKTPALVGGRQPVDGSGVTQPVSQQGTWTTGRTWALSQTTDSVFSWLKDGSGNALSSFLDPGDGERHLAVGIIQDNNVSSANSSTSNLASGASFTGTSVSTSAVNSVNVTLFSDQPVMISVQESQDGTNWDFVRTFTTIPNVGSGRVVQATSSFVRIIATNIGTATTTSFRLQTVLLPISTPNPAPLSSNRVITGTISTACLDANINSCAATSYVVINAEGAGTVIAQHNPGWVGVVVFDVSYDNGTTWEQQSSIDTSVNSLSDNLRYFVKWSNTRINDRWAINPAGSQLVRLRAAVLSSGTIPVILTASHATFYVNQVERRNPTYTASIVSFTTGTTATDIAGLCGSATKTIKIFNIGYSASETNQNIENVTLIKRSTADTGGTLASPNMAVVPYDSQDGAATATANAYTANPTVGTTVGVFRPSRVLIPPDPPGANAASQFEKNWNFDSVTGRKALYLRGTNECIYVNQNGVTFTGNQTSVYFEFTEE